MFTWQFGVGCEKSWWMLITWHQAFPLQADRMLNQSDIFGGVFAQRGHSANY